MNQGDVIRMVGECVDEITNAYEDISVQCDQSGQDLIKYIEDLYNQAIENFSDSGTDGLLISKTPRDNRKKLSRIKSLSEDSKENDDDNNNDVIEMTTRSPQSLCKFKKALPPLETETFGPRRTKREASIQAQSHISKQSSITLNTKLRKPSPNRKDVLVTPDSSGYPKSLLEKSNNDLDKVSSTVKKQKKIVGKRNGQNNYNESSSVSEIDEKTFTEDSSLKNKTNRSNKRKFESEVENIRTDENKGQHESREPLKKKANSSKSLYYQTLDRISEQSIPTGQHDLNFPIKNVCSANIADNTVEQSLYEDAIGKQIPIMSSTLNPNSIVTMDKLMSATVVIEPILRAKFNETVVISKLPSQDFHSNSKENRPLENDANFVKSSSDKPTIKKKDLKLKLKSKIALDPEKIAELLSDDESSPERKNVEKFRSHRPHCSSNSNPITSEDEVLAHSPNLLTIKTSKRSKIPTPKIFTKKELFNSSYAKDYVKKRVEAFEKAAISPNSSEDNHDRLTRNKIRALESATKAARRSLAKAIAIKNAHDRNNAEKENEKINISGLVRTGNSVDKSAQKNIYSKTTPLTKNRLPICSSASRNPQTPNQNTGQYTRSMTGSASKGRIITNVDSFIHTNLTVSASKQNTDNYVEEKRRRNEEDAKKKKEELLKAQSEEKRRKREEKQLKNKLARQAKERLEIEKRLEAEREKEDKLKQQRIEEKAREKAERKRILAQQRADVKEQRHQEEFLKKQRIAEQAASEKLLAEQKQLEQEAEDRRIERKWRIAQIQKSKKNQSALNYIIDSEPGEDDSDDENQPKHKIPQWALKSVRYNPLNKQQYVPMKWVIKFFDSKRCTPDLTEMFCDIDLRKIKRSSSAHWTIPPRLSMMNDSTVTD